MIGHQIHQQEPAGAVVELSLGKACSGSRAAESFGEAIGDRHHLGIPHAGVGPATLLATFFHAVQVTCDTMARTNDHHLPGAQWNPAGPVREIRGYYGGGGSAPTLHPLLVTWRVRPRVGTVVGSKWAPGLRN